MIMLKKINFVKQFYKSKSLPLTSESLTNMFVKIYETDISQSRNAIALFGCAGLRELVSFSNYEPVYGIKSMGDYLYAVVGSTVYQVNDGFVATNIGQITETAGKVRMSVNNNGYELVILTQSGNAWVYNANTTTFAQITDGDYQTASDITSIDGYNVYSVKDSDQFFPCVLRDATSFDALDYQTAEGEPDKLVAIREFQAGLWAFGEKTLEFYRNVGGSPIFQRTGSRKRIGCLSRDSVSQINDIIFWLSDNRKICKGSGYQYVEISTDPINEELETFSITELKNSTSFCYTNEGHDFYVITFPDKDLTLSYDLQTGLWHKRESYINETNKTTRWRANCFENFAGRRIVGDYKEGKLYYLDNSYYQEDGNYLIAKIISTPFFNNLIRTSINSLYIDMETGVGTTSGEGNDPKIMFQSSDDGGRTYSSELQIPIGELGKYKTIVKICPIGQSDNFTLKLSISDPIRRRIYAGYIEYEEGEI